MRDLTVQRVFKAVEAALADNSSRRQAA
jgi:hypothetical protein